VGERLPFSVQAPYPSVTNVSSTTDCGKRIGVVNEAQNFRGDFIKTGSTIKWSSIQDGFSFESEDPDPTRSFGATLGREQNGVFFNET
jgi:hypothetical protein